MNSQGPGQIHVGDVNGFPWELTYVHLQGRQWPCPFQERPWPDQDVHSNVLSVPVEGFGRRSGMNMNVLCLGTERTRVWQESRCHVRKKGRHT